MKARMEKAMPEIFEKYAGPDELWLFPGVSATAAATTAALWALIVFIFSEFKRTLRPLETK